MSRPKGRLDGFSALDIALEAGWGGDPNELVSKLVEAGFLDVLDEGIYALHDWEEHQPFVVQWKTRSERAKKAIEARWRKCPRAKRPAEQLAGTPNVTAAERSAKRPKRPADEIGNRVSIPGEYAANTPSLPQECSPNTPSEPPQYSPNTPSLPAEQPRNTPSRVPDQSPSPPCVPHGQSPPRPGLPEDHSPNPSSLAPDQTPACDPDTARIRDAYAENTPRIRDLYGEYSPSMAPKGKIDAARIPAVFSEDTSRIQPVYAEDTRSKTQAPEGKIDTARIRDVYAENTTRIQPVYAENTRSNTPYHYEESVYILNSLREHSAPEGADLSLEVPGSAEPQQSPLEVASPAEPGQPGAPMPGIAVSPNDAVPPEDATVATDPLPHPGLPEPPRPHPGPAPTPNELSPDQGPARDVSPDAGSRTGNQESAAIPDRPQGPSYLSRRKRRLTGWNLQSFSEFWKMFDYKKGKAEAADAWLDIPDFTPELAATVIEAAAKEARARPALIARGGTPKWAQGWLAGRRWEDWDGAEPDPTGTSPDRGTACSREMNHDPKVGSSDRDETARYQQAIREAVRKFM